MQRPGHLHQFTGFPLLNMMTEGSAITCQFVSLRLESLCREPSHCKPRHGLTQSNLHLQGNVICHQLSGKAGISLLACIASAGRRPLSSRTNHLYPLSSQLWMPDAAFPVVSTVAAIQLPLILSCICCRSWQCFVSGPSLGMCKSTCMQVILNHQNPLS